jgi:Protein of unknown function (DUF2924)
MAQDISRRIAQLTSFSRQKLLNLWQKEYGRPAPTGIRRTLLAPFLAYRIQENAYGGLAASTRTELRRIARDLEKGTASASSAPRTRIKAGSRIVRMWRGQAHEIFVTESGYEHRGTNYPNLSQIARKITGTRWSGPAFFGLRKRPAAAK